MEPTKPAIAFEGRSTDDNALMRAAIREMADALGQPNARRSRARSIAITKLEEAGMWLAEDTRLS